MLSAVFLRRKRFFYVLFFSLFLLLKTEMGELMIKIRPYKAEICANYA